MSQFIGPWVNIPSPLPVGQPVGGHAATPIIALHHDAVSRFGYIAGVVSISGTPGGRRVCLKDRKSQRLIEETFSDDAGAYRFNGLDVTRRYTVYAIDHTDAYNAVIADNISPVPV